MARTQSYYIELTTTSACLLVTITIWFTQGLVNAPGLCTASTVSRVLPNRTLTMPTGTLHLWFPAVIISTGSCGRGTQMTQNGTCEDCAGHLEKCDVDPDTEVKPCCSNEKLTCVPWSTEDDYECVCEDELVWDGEMCAPTVDNRLEFMTAAQIALGAALVVAVAALAVLTCKMCKRRDVRSNGVQRDSNTSSLNSLQRFVNRRLRDRPPRYDDPAAMPDKPPAYEEINGPNAQSPPPAPPLAMPHRLLRGRRRSNRVVPIAPPVYTESLQDAGTTTSYPSNVTFTPPEECQITNPEPAVLTTNSLDPEICETQPKDHNFPTSCEATSADLAVSSQSANISQDVAPPVSQTVISGVPCGEVKPSIASFPDATQISECERCATASEEATQLQNIEVTEPSASLSAHGIDNPAFHNED